MPEKIDDIYEEFHSTVNMTNSELDAWAESDNYDVYKDEKSAGQPIDEPRPVSLRGSLLSLR